MKGSYVLRSYDSVTKKLIEEIKVENLIVSSNSGYGRNLIMRQLGNDPTYPIAIDSAKIGTGTATPADTDTDLQTPAVATIEMTSYEVTNDRLVISMFITDANLPNGIYTEFGLFCNGRLFARSLIIPTYNKISNRETSIEYTIELSAV